MLKMKTHPGQHIRDACAAAVVLATQKNTPVEFTFNDTMVTVLPNELPNDVEARWNSDKEANYRKLINSAEYKESLRKHEEEERRKDEAHLVEKAQTEKEMRDAVDPWPRTPAQLNEYVESLVSRSNDYGTCVYAMSLAATAALNYVAHKLGVTGFQASCADLDFLRRSRHMKGPFMIINAEDALYPQYNLREKLEEALRDWKPWLKEEAKKLLAERDGCTAVREHWERLAK